MHGTRVSRTEHPVYCITCTLWDLSYHNGLGNNLIINGYNRGMMGIFRARIDYLGRSRVPESSVDYAGWRHCAGHRTAIKQTGL